MLKNRLVSIISVLFALALLMSSCDIGDVFDSITDVTTEQPSQMPSADDPTDDPIDDSGFECTHKYGEWETVLEATCTQKGKKVRVCSLCMQIENSDIDLEPHKPELLNKIEPTCETDGKTEGEICSACKEILTAQETIKANGHQYTEGICHCGANDPDYVPDNEYTVVFKDYDGTILSTQSVKEGASATAPQNPVRDGYEFIGWDNSFDQVTTDITIYAVYEKISTEPQFIVSSTDAKRDEAIEVTVALKNNPGIASIILSVAFDSDALTLTEVVYNTAIGGQSVQPQNMNNPVKIYWINGFADAEGDFVLATLKFTVKSDAAVGDHNITLSYIADDVYDISETNLPFEIVGGKVTVKQ